MLSSTGIYACYREGCMRAHVYLNSNETSSPHACPSLAVIAEARPSDGTLRVLQREGVHPAEGASSMRLASRAFLSSRAVVWVLKV